MVKEISIEVALISIIVMITLGAFAYYNENNNSILFYSFNNFAVCSLGGFVFLSSVACLILKKRFFTHILHVTVIAGLILYSINLTFITNVDRSCSVNMISLIASSENGVSPDELKRRVELFLVNNDGFNQRIKEQEATGTIYQADGRIYITEKGLRLHKFFVLIGDFFKIKGDNYNEQL